MSRDTKTSNSNDDNDDFVEMQNLIAQNDLEGGNRAQRAISNPKKSKGCLERLVQPIEERYSIKMLTRVWGPRLEFVVRLMLVATFLDDSLRMATHFIEQILQVSEQGCLSSLGVMSPVFATVALAIGLFTQSVGAYCLLKLREPDLATKALIAWMIAQPMLYGQLSNFEFVTESISIIGGLLLLRAHLVYDQASHGVGARTQLLGRLLLPAMYMYYAWLFLFYDFNHEETSSIGMYISSLSKSFVETAVVIGFVIGCTLLFFGLKSRVVALFLALINLGFVTYLHPFFRYIYIEGWEWKYDDISMSMPQVAVRTDVSPEEFVIDPAEIYDLHRYYFFMGLSTSGALLLLAQFGPGEIAVQKNEVLLPATRALN